MNNFKQLYSWLCCLINVTNLTPISQNKKVQLIRTIRERLPITLQLRNRYIDLFNDVYLCKLKCTYFEIDLTRTYLLYEGI